MISFPNAKINLGLHILERRPDKYHNIETVFYPLQLTDMLEFVPADELRFSTAGIPIDGPEEHNLVLKAYRLLAHDFDLLPLHIHLHKIIPFGAGLGGGSADAAYMLRMLNEDFNLQLSSEQLEDYARSLGSDCAFFVRNEPVYAHQRGDVFESVSVALKGYHLLLVKPAVAVSTQQAYAGVRPRGTAPSLRSIIEQPIERWREVLVNDFEATVFPQFPQIANIKEQLYAQGAVYAAMSGSGASVFGIFDTDKLPVELFGEHFVWTERL